MNGGGNIVKQKLEICITPREIYRMLIIMLTMRQKDLPCVYMFVCLFVGV